MLRSLSAGEPAAKKSPALGSPAPLTRDPRTLLDGRASVNEALYFNLKVNVIPISTDSEWPDLTGGLKFCH